tara:strand:+ start:493 stop:897 length:405 start_codon:yes stop_codon:yes gene_type:complete
MDIESTHENLVLREFNKIPKGLSKENAELFYHILSSHEKPDILKAKNEFLQRKKPKRRKVNGTYERKDEQTDGMIQEKKVQNMGMILERFQEAKRKQEKLERQQEKLERHRNKRRKLEKKDSQYPVNEENKYNP